VWMYLRVQPLRAVFGRSDLRYLRRDAHPWCPLTMSVACHLSPVTCCHQVRVLTSSLTYEKHGLEAARRALADKELQNKHLVRPRSIIQNQQHQPQ
jgi:hypothetical protein